MDNINMLDVFSGDAFTVRALTDAIQNVPIKYGRVTQLGLFTDKPIDTSIAMVEINNGVLNLIPSSPRGTPAPKNKTGKRDLKPFIIPRIALDDLILPEDIQNVRAFGTADLQTPASVTADRLAELSNKHDITGEYLKCGALAGIVYDADGSELLNLFDTFGVSQNIVYFDLSNDDANMQDKCNSVVGTIADNMAGDTMTVVRGLWAPDVWAKFITHPSVQKAYENYNNMITSVAGFAGATANPLRDDVRQGFYFGGIIHEEYRGKATYLNGDNVATTRDFVAAGTAQFFPMGTTQTFRNYLAPADWMETINTLGQPKYAKVVPENGNRFTEVLSQSNPLPICMRPKLLIQGNQAASA